MSQTNEIIKAIERQKNGKIIVEGNRKMISRSAEVVGENETKMVLNFRDYVVEIFFSDIQPLMVIRLVKFLEIPVSYELYKIANDLTKDCVYGSHCFDREKNRYYFQATQWLDGVLSSKIFYEMLKRYDAEAQKILKYFMLDVSAV